MRSLDPLLRPVQLPRPPYPASRSISPAHKIALNLKVKGKNPEHAVFSPDGKWLYVSAEEAHRGL